MNIIWSEPQKPNSDCRYDHVYWESKIFGKVYIEWKSWKDYPSYDCIVQNPDLNIIVDVCEQSLQKAKIEVEKQLLKLLNEEI